MFKGFAQWIVLVKFNMFKFWDNGSSNLKLENTEYSPWWCQQLSIDIQSTCLPRNILDVLFDGFCLPSPRGGIGNFYWISSYKKATNISTWMTLYNFQSITRKGKYKIDFLMMLSRNDCVLKTSGNFKITSLVARYSLSSTRQPITSSLISPLGIVPLLPSLIITPRSYEACTQQSCTQYTNSFAYFLHWPVTFCPRDI